MATNLDDTAQDILAVSHDRYKIEDYFRIMKTNFSDRPAFHWTKPRIRAHFLICYTALLVYRLLECQLDNQKTHVTTENLITTLQNMNVVNIHDVEYMATYRGSKTLDALTRLSSLELDRAHYHPRDLDRKIKKFCRYPYIQHYKSRESSRYKVLGFLSVKLGIMPQKSYLCLFYWLKY